jgi:hypothetical protein
VLNKQDESRGEARKLILIGDDEDEEESELGGVKMRIWWKILGKFLDWILRRISQKIFLIKFHN